MITKLFAGLGLISLFFILSFSALRILIMAKPGEEEKLINSAPGAILALIILSIPAVLLMDYFFDLTRYNIIEEEKLEEYKKMEESPGYYIGKDISEVEQ